MSPKARQDSTSNKLVTANNSGTRTRATRRATVLQTRSSARLSRSSRSRNESSLLNSSIASSSEEYDRSIRTPLSTDITVTASTSSSLTYTSAREESDPTNISIVDLASPSPTTMHRTSVRQPLEVDLTCDIDEEVFVVLEDIVNPNRRGNDLPIVLGTSPPRRRPVSRRTRRPLLQPSGRTSSHSSIEEISNGPASSADLPPSPQGQDHSRGIQCPICLESLAQIKSLNRQMQSTTCGHLFCNTCITRALASMPQCPTCRKPLTTRKIHPIFI